MSADIEKLFDAPNSSKGIRQRLGAHVYLLLIALLTGGPYVIMMLISLMGKGWSPVVPPKVIPVQWSLQNYVNVWLGKTDLIQLGFGRFFLNSIIYASAATIIVVVVDSLAGYAFARLEFRGRDVTFVGMLATIMVSPMVLFIPVYLLFNQIGLVNTYIGIILVHTYSGFGVFLMRQFIKTIPTSLEEAALMDGCSRFGVFWRIVVPMMKPALATLAVITFITTWNSFLWPVVLARTSELYNLPVALAYFQGRISTLWAPLMTAAAITMIPAVIAFISMQRYYVRGFVLGGMKGS